MWKRRDASAEKDLPYLEETPDGWVYEVTRSWDVVENETSTRVDVSGDCPTCAHPCSDVFETVVGTMSSDALVFPISLVCNCSRSHPGRPDGRVGCGRGGSFKLALDGRPHG
jgi:hypothetical protein